MRHDFTELLALLREWREQLDSVPIPVIAIEPAIDIPVARHEADSERRRER